MNEKALIREIKRGYANGRGQIFWQRINEYHFVSDGHWAIKILNLSPKVLGTLVSIFGLIPEEGKSLRIAYNGIKEGPDINKIYEEQSKSIKVADPKIFIDMGDYRTRLLTFNKSLAFIKESYFSLVGKGEKEYFTDGELKPVMVKTNTAEIMLLPVRTGHENKNLEKFISERIGA